MLKITTANGVLAVAADTSIPLTITNPMVNDRGSGSLPFSIPDCEHNQKTLGYPNRITRSAQGNISIAATIETDEKTYAGTLKYVSTSGGRIELTFYTQEGSFWDWAKSTRLRDITVPDNKAFVWNQDIDGYINSIYPDVEMAFFPIALTKDVTRDNKIGSLPDDTDFYTTNEYRQNSYFLLNEPHNLVFKPHVRGARITGFLYVMSVLDWIFNEYGLRYDVNDLASIDELKRCVVLNSAVEPFRGDLIRYKELLPSGTVMDFINAIENKFYCRFYINESKKTVDAKLFKNLPSQTPVEVNASISQIKSELLQIVLKNSKVNSDNTTISDSLTEAQIEAADTFEEELTPPREHNLVYVNLPAADKTTYPEKVVFNIPTQCYFTLIWEENTDGTWDYKAKVFHSRYYDYEDKTTSDKKDITPGSSFVPMVYPQVRQFFKTDHVLNPESYFDYFVLMPHYAVEKTSYFVNELLDTVYDWDIDMPISFAFYRGKITIHLPDHFYVIFAVSDPALNEDPLIFHELTEYEFPWGSTDVYTHDGEKLTGALVSQPNLSDADIALRWASDFGLVENFFKELEQFYLKSAKEVDIANIKLSDLLDNDIFAVFQNQDNVNFIIKEIKLTLTPFGTRFDSATGLTVKPYV